LRARGDAKAAELQGDCEASVVHSETAPLVIRHDLTSM